MAGVDAALHRLQVVAFLQTLADEHLGRRQAAPLDLGRRRLLVRRPHVGPHQAAALDARIGLDGHELAQLRRRRHLDAAPVAGELEAVIGAADAAFLVAAEIQRGAAMGAELVDQPDLARAVAERQQLLAEDRHAHLRSVGRGDLARQQHRDPVAAHQVAHPGAGARAHQRLRHLPIHGTLPAGPCRDHDSTNEPNGARSPSRPRRTGAPT